VLADVGCLGVGWEVAEFASCRHVFTSFGCEVGVATNQLDAVTTN